MSPLLSASLSSFYTLAKMIFQRANRILLLRCLKYPYTFPLYLLLYYYYFLEKSNAFFF